MTMRNIFTPMVHPWYALFAKFMLSRIEFWASAFSLKFLELSQDFENTVFQSCDFGSISLALQSPVITAEYGIILDQSLYIYRVVQKTAQSLWHHNFATVHHRVKRFSAKCFERNSLHDLSQCLNTAVKYSLFLQLAIKLLKNNVPCP